MKKTPDSLSRFRDAIFSRYHSQRMIASTDDYCDFELTLRPTSDFKAQLLSRGQWVEVLEPQSLAEEIIEWHKNAIERYKK
ncbi:MAG: WYL domain-containing protein [Prevotella sp.]|nr:WYL domain-containing protein [Prevotella sp.]